jgi:anti-sigma factor RsiW
MDESQNRRCLKVLDLLPRFIENDFTDEESAEILAHLESCPSCQAEYEAMRHLVDTLETLRQLPSAGKTNKP